MITEKELQLLQSYSLDIKIERTKKRLLEAIQQFTTEGLYLSFSGGKDSIVLHTILKELELELYGKMKIQRVFCDTGLEYPALKELTLKMFKGNEDILTILKPKHSFLEILKIHGYPVITKEQSQYIFDVRNTKSPKQLKRRLEGTGAYKVGKVSDKWKYLIDSDFRISDKCCYHMKKSPFISYEKKNKKVAIIGTMASESRSRKQSYLKTGCNSFSDNVKRKFSKPLSIWTEKDILEYIYRYNIEIPSPYGKVIKEGNEYKLTGMKRTGCMFCLYGIHLEKDRLKQLKELEPKLYNYCLKGGTYDNEGFFIPSKGLGYRKILKDIGVQIEED